ncbi:MAG: glycosyltransferase family 2 protein [Verrucomicrobiota bacterium]
MPKIAVVIPAYRAAASIAEVIRGIPSWVDSIVVVEDGGGDNTAELAANMAKIDRRIHVVCHSFNQGIGGAVLSGYQLACQLKAEIIVKMDSDGQMDVAYLPQLIAPLVAGEADYTKGNRFLHTEQLKTMPILRLIGNIALSFLAKLASGYWNVFDPTNGYTAIKAALARRLCVARLDKRYFFETSILLELGLMRAVVRDVFIPSRYGNEISYLSKRRTIMSFPGKLIKGLLRRIWVQYFVRDFSIGSVFFIGGMVFFLFGAIFGLMHWIQSALTRQVASTGTVMLAVLPIILGVQLLLQVIVLDVQNVPHKPIFGEYDIE